MTSDYDLAEIRERLDTHIVTGSYSSGLVEELADHVACGTYNVFAILGEIGYLEQEAVPGTRTKMARQFKKRPLKGLWYKHHTQGRFIVRNIMNEWQRGTFFEKVFEPHFGQELTSDLAGRI